MPPLTSLTSQADLAWLREVHLSHLNVPTFDQAVLIGNEDCPTNIELHYVDGPFMYLTRIDGELVISPDEDEEEG